MPSPSFFALTPPDKAPGARKTADELIVEYLHGLSQEERQAFHAESMDLAQAMQAALEAWLAAHPQNTGPWMWVAAANMLAYGLKRSLEDLVAELEAETAAKDGDA